MKKFWVSAENFDKKIVTAALESGADAVLIPEKHTEKVKELGLITTIAKDGDLKLGKDVERIEIKNKEDEKKAAQLKTKYIIIKTSDWTIIPLENLIAQRSGLIAEVNNSKDAKTALTILEKGVDGVLLKTNDINEIKETAKIIKQDSEKLTLVEAKIKNIKSVGLGDRVCIDTCTNMKLGQGMLVGDSSSGMFLVHSESIENPYVEPRPFRVNAGAVHAYVKSPDGKTKYLSELKTGEEVLIVNSKGNTQLAIVGRAKIERRPMLLVEAEHNGKNLSLVLQNAETIRLVTPDGNPVSVVKLKKEDKVLAYIEESGRHFGMRVKETIEEK